MRSSALILALLLPVAAHALPVSATAGQAPAAPAANPTQSAVFKVFARGIPVGTEQASIAFEKGEWVITSTSTLGAPVALILRRAEARYTTDWRPLSVVVDGAFRDQQLQLETTFGGGQASSRFLQNGQHAEKTEAISDRAIALPNNFFASYTALAVRLATLAAGDEIRAYVPPQGEIGITVREVTTERMQTAGRAFELRRSRLALPNQGGTLDADLWAETDGRLVRISIPAAALDVVREDVASVSARQQTFHREGDVDVRIPGNGFSIAGTISKPRATVAAAGPPARLPAIVLVAGSGSLDREEFVAGIPIFGQLSSALADAGFLVVRYDKRGVGQSGGRAEAVTLQDYAEDLRAVVRYLEDRGDVDPKRIAVAGHSEGAWVAMAAAAREKKIAALVLMAGPATSGAELVLEQQRHALERSSFADTEKRARVDLQKKIHQAMLAGGSWEGVPDDLRKQADTPWFASFLAFDPKTVMAKVRQPILIVQGDLDRQVPVPHAEALAQLAKARKNDPGAEVVTVPGVNHLLVPAKTGEVDEYGSLTERQVSPRVAEAISEWLKRSTAPQRSSRE